MHSTIRVNNPDHRAGMLAGCQPTECMSPTVDDEDWTFDERRGTVGARWKDVPNVIRIVKRARHTDDGCIEEYADYGSVVLLNASKPGDSGQNAKLAV